MKSNATSKTPFDKDAMLAALAAAPERVEDPDCSYDPNDAAAVEAFWAKGFVTHSREELAAELAKRRERRHRGPNIAPKKERVTIRLSPEVVKFFKETGKGWQTRLDSVLKDWLRAHSHAKG
jgi:uncharacterized protein (DUF4415 family)